MQASEKTIADHVVALQRRPDPPANAYLYGEDHLPHDAVDSIIHHRLIGSGDKTKSIESLMRAAGRKVRVAPKLLKPDALNAARTIFPLCRFDAVKCADGLQSLRHYQWDRSEIEPGKRKPLHDQYSHGADAFLTAAVSIRREPFQEAYAASNGKKFSTDI